MGSHLILLQHGLGKHALAVASEAATKILTPKTLVQESRPVSGRKMRTTATMRVTRKLVPVSLCVQLLALPLDARVQKWDRLQVLTGKPNVSITSCFLYWFSHAIMAVSFLIADLSMVPPALADQCIPMAQERCSMMKIEIGGLLD